MIALLLAALLAQAPAAPDACLGDGTNVTLAGTVGVATAPGDPAHGRAPFRYAVLKLDHPICVRGAASGLVPAAEFVALVAPQPNAQLPFRFKGDRARVMGRLERVTSLKQPPLDLMIADPQIVSDQ